MNAPLHEIERMMRAQSRELMRSMMQAHFDQRAAQERPVAVRGADGIERAQARHSPRTVMTEFGEVVLERTLYQAPGAEGLAPLDAAMGLAEEKYSHEVRRIVAEESARASFDEVVELVRKQSGAEVPKRQVEELAQRSARDFDEFYRSRLREAEDTEHLLVLSFDGKGIAMRLDDLRDATRKAAEATPRRMHTRLVKGEKPNRKRMAEVAAVYSLKPWPRTIADVLHGLNNKRDTDRPRPTNKRVWASVEHTAQRVIDDAFAEALRRDPERRRRWVVLVDGNREDRMGRTGARWSLAGAEAVLRLRALRTSGDFDDYWQFHLDQEHQRTHASRYADAAVPNPLPPSRPQLKLVK